MQIIPTTLLLLFLISCGAQQHAKNCATAANGDGLVMEGSDEPVAHVNGDVITERELIAAAADELSEQGQKYQEKVYEIKKENLEKLVMERLVEAKAKREGISPDELLEREVAALIGEPTEEQLKEVYNETASKFGGAFPPFLEVKPQIREAILTQLAETAEMAYFDKLSAEADVEILLIPLLPKPINVPSDGPSKGNPEAVVTIVEFADFECTFCAKAQATIAKIFETYHDQVRLVYRDFPMPFHRFAAKAAEAAHCAGDQDKYWEMHELLYKNSDTLRVEDLKAYAKEIGLDEAQFNSCLDSSEKESQVKESLRLGKKLGIQGAPSFFINGRRLSGAQPFEQFKELIDYEIKAASK